MGSTGYIVDFNSSDGLPPLVVQKLNHNLAALSGLSPAGGSGGGSVPQITDYDDLSGRPSINGVTLTGNMTSTDLGIQDSVLLTAYPVGSIYMSVNSTSPAMLFGGTWERITGKFLLAATDGGSTGTDVNSTASAEAGATGGEASHTLSGNESGVPAHSHGLGNHTHSLQNHTHTTNIGSHGHGAPIGGDNGATRLESAYSSLNGSSNSAWAVWWGGGYNAKDNVYVPSTNIGNKTSGGPSNNTSGTPSTNSSDNNSAANASSAHNNMPPFLAVYVWKRVA